MFAKCTHTLESGSTCQSPAVRGTKLCFHHTPHQKLERKWPHESEPLELPALTSKNNILIAVGDVLRAMAERRIKRSEADTLLHGLKFLDRLMTELDQQAPSLPVGPGIRIPGRSQPNPPSSPTHARISKQAHSAWPGTKPPSLSESRINHGDIFKPYLKSAGINPHPHAPAWSRDDEPSFVQLLCSKASAAAMAQASQPIHG
ncbi:MAG: hypothetical protein JST28_11675 [Acidobacteria bacterium]|nr:hypothetical protein [Acidobacteriota bacterium]